MGIGKSFMSLAAIDMVLVIVGGAWAQGRGGGGRPSFDRLLKAFDANGDGMLVADRKSTRLNSSHRT